MTVAHTSMEEISRWVLPFFAALAPGTSTPVLSRWLPDALGIR